MWNAAVRHVIGAGHLVGERVEARPEDQADLRSLARVKPDGFRCFLGYRPGKPRIRAHGGFHKRTLSAMGRSRLSLVQNAVGGPGSTPANTGD